MDEPVTSASSSLLRVQQRSIPTCDSLLFQLRPQSAHTAATPNSTLRVGCSSYDVQSKLDECVLNCNLNEQADHLYDPRANPGTYVDFDPYGFIVHSPSAGYGAHL